MDNSNIPFIALGISGIAITISALSLWVSWRNQHHTQIVSFEQRRQEVRQSFFDGQLLVAELHDELKRGLTIAEVHPGKSFKRSEVYRSVVRHPKPDTPRGRAMTSFQNFFLHIYPVKVPRQIIRTRTTLRLGFIAAVLYGILFISGTYLMFFYRPTVPDAYFDMHTLSTSVAFGQFVRNVHRWSAHLMVVIVILHLLRVFYSGAYRPPRQFNWVIGVGCSFSPC